MNRLCPICTVRPGKPHDEALHADARMNRSPAVLLRDTPEDRERFIQIVRDTRIPMDGPYLDAVRDYAESLIAALRAHREAKEK